MSRLVTTADTSVTVSISIDTEEDDWGSYDEHGASTRNIDHLRELQDVFDRWGARPTYLVNYAPLANQRSATVLADLAGRESVEIGAHCHPWNTPPLTGGGSHRSMMSSLSAEENLAKIGEVRRVMFEAIGVRPRTFRAGRWALGPTVAGPLVDLDFHFDCSVSPFVDWSSEGGPDYTYAPHRPYRFRAADPLGADPTGSLVGLPTTVGFLSGDHRRRAALRGRLSRSPVRHLKIVGLLDSLGLLARRWLSPETSSADTMIQLARSWVASGERFLQMTFHSCTLLPGATPFVADEEERSAFLGAIDKLLEHCQGAGYDFRTLAEAGAEWGTRTP